MLIALIALFRFKSSFPSSNKFAGSNVGLPESALVLTPKTQIRFQDLTTCGTAVAKAGTLPYHEHLVNLKHL